MNDGHIPEQEGISDSGDFQRLHYIQCVFYGIMISAMDESKDVRRDIFNRIQGVISDFQKDELPKSYKACKSGKDFVNLIMSKVWSNITEKQKAEINENTSNLYNLIKNPIDGEAHVTQINILSFSEHDKLFGVDGSYIVANVTPKDFANIIKSACGGK